MRVGNTLFAFAEPRCGSFELLRRRDTAYVQRAGRLAHFGTDNSTRFIVVDVRVGRVVGTTGPTSTIVLGS